MAALAALRSRLRAQAQGSPAGAAQSLLRRQDQGKPSRLARTVFSTLYPWLPACCFTARPCAAPQGIEKLFFQYPAILKKPD